MHLHIGNGQTVPQDKIIGIFDLDTVTISSQSREFLARAEKEKKVSYLDSDLPRSFVLIENGEIQLSRISTVGLKTRIHSPLGNLEE